jgi:hypothetical protein
MPDFVNEDYVTIADEVVFPQVQTCCALVVSSTLNGQLGGYHFTLRTEKVEMDRALLYFKTEIGGNVDAIYLVGNVLQRQAIIREGMGYSAPLKATLSAGLGVGFGIKYFDIGANNLGVAVRAWRDPIRNLVKLSIAGNGNWAMAANVVPSARMFTVKEVQKVATDYTPFARVRMALPRPGGVRSCTINVANEISTFGMSEF